MTHVAERIVRILLEDGPTIRGEYWIIDGDVAFADGDVGDMNHEGYAIDHARRLMIDRFEGDSDQEYFDEDALKDAVISYCTENGIPVDPEDWASAADQILSQDPNPQQQLAVFHCALGAGDAREVAMRYWGWKWCRRNNIATWTFTDKDRRDIISGLEQIGNDEFDEDDTDWDSLEVDIGVSSSGIRHNITLGELKSGRTPSQDPTWGRMRHAQESQDDEMMRYMEPEIDRLTRNRKLNVGEEVSNGTLDAITLCRRGLKKLEEIHPLGFKRFKNINSEAIATLETIITATEAGDTDWDEDSPQAHGMIDDLWETLTQLFSDDYCPFGTHFGPNEGSYSCFGCWPSEDYLRDLVGGGEAIERVFVGTTFAGWVDPEREWDVKYIWYKTNRGDKQALYDAKSGQRIWAWD